MRIVTSGACALVVGTFVYLLGGPFFGASQAKGLALLAVGAACLLFAWAFG